MIEDREARTAAIKSALESYDESGVKRTIEINFRTRKILLPVVTVTPNVLLLNHNNSRLFAQLVDHSQKDEVYRDPSSIEAQDVLTQLLRATDKFKDLKEQLRTLEQQQPGLVTRDGLLINGNTRTVALRELGVAGIDVAVLPADTNSSDLLEIEMSLQMTRLIHQNYTFTNELMLMDRYVKANHTHEQLAKTMGWMRGGRGKVDTRLRILAIIEEVRTLSNSYLPYHIFDTKEEHLKDLDKEYQRLKNSGDVDAAERMKWSRLSAILLGVNKDQVRTIDDCFFEEEVEKWISEDPAARKMLEQVRRVAIGGVDDGLDDLLGKSSGNEERLDMKLFVQAMLNEPAVRDENGGVASDLNGPYAGVAQGARLAADQIIKNERWNTLLVEPSTALRDVQINLQEIIEKFAEVRAKKGFDSGKFKFELKRVQKAVSELEVLVKKSDS
jgi:hypothetical protein